jgi:protease PrsW
MKTGGRRSLRSIATTVRRGVSGRGQVAASPIFWLFALFLAGSAWVFSLQQVRYLTHYPAAWALSVALLLATAAPAIFLIHHFDEFEPEPRALIMAAVLWGGVIAITFAVYANTYFLDFLQHRVSAKTFSTWGAAIVAPPTEEFFKGTGLVAIFLLARKQFNSTLDGLVYGAAIGLAFQSVENINYFILAASATRGARELTAVLGTYFVRVVITGVYTHALFTGLVGYGFAYAVSAVRRTRLVRGAVLSLFVLIALGAHFFWDSPLLDSLNRGKWTGLALVALAKGIPFVLLLVILAIVSRRKERNAFARMLALEEPHGLVSSDEVSCLLTAQCRVRAVRLMTRNRGTTAARWLKRLQREQLKLAALHTRGNVGDETIELQRNRVRSLKAVMQVWQ